MLALILLLAEAAAFDLQGQLVPEISAAVYLSAVGSPFSTSTTSDGHGRFRFSHIPAGSYTLGVFTPGRGETNHTVDIGPSGADANGKIALTIQIDDTRIEVGGSHTVSARELSIPNRARREYLTAEKLLAKNNAAGAIAHLEKAVGIAPQYSLAWNHLGTIAYKTQRYSDAEKYFRKALEADSEAYAPLVNLGGVLLNLGMFREALRYNQYAVLKRPGDALANAQLGITYFSLGQYSPAEKYLREALRIDAGHFSNPQLVLAEMALRRGDLKQAADWFAQFLKQHPDWPDAVRMRADIALWQSGPPK